MLQEVISFYNKHNRSPKSKEIKSRNSLIYKYGSWNNVLKAAGLPANKKNYSKERLITSLIDFYKKYNKPPTSQDCNKYDMLFSHCTYLRNLDCNSWNCVLLKAGLKGAYEKSKLTHLSDDELISLIKTLLKFSDKKTREWYKKHRGALPSLTYLEERFGGWTNVLRMAGLPVNSKHYSNDDIIESFYNSKKHFGEVPSFAKFSKYTGLSLPLIKKRFGSWRDFLISIGEIPLTKGRDYVDKSNDELIKIYKEFSERNGFPNGATHSALNNSNEIYGTSIFYYRFGSLNNLREICGYKPVGSGLKIMDNKNEVLQAMRECYDELQRIPKLNELSNFKNLPSAGKILAITNETSLYRAFHHAIYKKCTRCDVMKIGTDFHYSKKSEDKLTYYCKSCRYIIQSEWVKKNKEKMNLYNKEYRKKNPERMKRYYKEYENKPERKKHKEQYQKSPQYKLSQLKKRLKIAKKQSTKDRLTQQIKETEQQIRNQKT